MVLFGSDSSLELRHPTACLRGDTLHLFFSCLGDRPEKIYHCAGNVSGDWNAWQFSKPEIVLTPERDWEGADLPVTTSIIGAADTRLCELRDPGIFIDAEDAYLLYSGAGESNIGIARLEDF